MCEPEPPTVAPPNEWRYTLVDCDVLFDSFWWNWCCHIADNTEVILCKQRLWCLVTNLFRTRHLVLKNRALERFLVKYFGASGALKE